VYVIRDGYVGDIRRWIGSTILEAVARTTYTQLREVGVREMLYVSILSTTAFTLTSVTAM